jgi:hypothetical protein
VPDDPDARLVVLGSAHPYIRERTARGGGGQGDLESRGNMPALPHDWPSGSDKVSLQDLVEAFAATWLGRRY